ncbi:MAG: hypothetical protein ACI92Z_001903 [Paracoccaceae bacterium]|jgi:uncharacterized protein YjiS (DUF1127 family)
MTIFTAAHTSTHISTQTPRATGTGLVRLLRVWSQRRALRKLDSAALSDIGLTRAQANRESRRSFWDAPETWRC